MAQTFLSNSLNTLGLCLDVIGFLILWKYGLSRDPEVGTSWGRDKKLESKYKNRSDIGLAIIIFGFLLQIASNFL